MRKLMISLFALGLFLLLVIGPANIEPVIQASDDDDSDCVPAPQRLVSWWPGDGNANDIQGNNDGTLQNGATFAPGKVGQAFSFDEFDDFVLVPHNSNLSFGDQQNFTIDAWINLQNPTPGFDDSIVSKWDVQNFRIGVTSNFYWLNLNRDNYKIRFTLGSGAIVYNLESVSAIPLGAWTHVAAVRDGTQGLIYINGRLDKSGPLTSGSVANSDPMAIGGVYDTASNPPVQLFHGFGGLIDEVEIFNRRLSAKAVRVIYKAGSAGKCKVFDLLSGYGEKDDGRQLLIRNAAERNALWSLEAALEKQLVPPFEKDYADQLSAARERVEQQGGSW